MKREMSVAGSFYPNDAGAIEQYFEHFTKLYNENFQLPHIKAKAVIVPHAGYIYSGFTADVAYRILQQNDIEDIVIIGPSHRVAFYGASICDFDSYNTPFGEIKASKKLFTELLEKFSFNCMLDAHHEHSTEVQFPFIKYYLPNVTITEIVYSETNPQSISEIIDFLLTREKTAIIISTDLSHFYQKDMANQLDYICIDAIKKLDLKEIHQGCEACGITGVEAMMLSAKKNNMHVKILDYRTSADASGDTDRVVGYLSSCFYN